MKVATCSLALLCSYYNYINTRLLRIYSPKGVKRLLHASVQHQTATSYMSTQMSGANNYMTIDINGYRDSIQKNLTSNFKVRLLETTILELLR